MALIDRLKLVFGSAWHTNSDNIMQAFVDEFGSDSLTGEAGAQGGDAVMTGGASSTTGNAGGVAKIKGGAPGATGVGGAAQVVAAAGGSTSGAGGAASVTAGAGTAGNAAGGAASVTAGAGQGTGAGGAASLVAGASGGGATGNGGAVSITGGTAGSTDGGGGSIVLTPGAKAGTGVDGAVFLESNIIVRKQAAPTAKSTSATLTAAELLAGIVTVNQAGGSTSALQLPTGTAIQDALPTLATGDSFDVSFMNISTVDAEDASVTTNTDLTLVGSMDFPAHSGITLCSCGVLRFRKTGDHAFSVYRIS